MNINIIYWIFPIALLISATTVHAESKGTPYVVANKSFLEIKDINRQAEAWAMCAATYDAMAEILAQERPARAKQISDLANGAELAVTMSMVTDRLDTDITPAQFDALWKIAQVAGETLPETRRTMLLAEMESSKDKENGNAFLENLSATFEVCINNLSGQQMYIDSWRELAKSGLLKLPNE